MAIAPIFLVQKSTKSSDKPSSAWTFQSGDPFVNLFWSPGQLASQMFGSRRWYHRATNWSLSLMSTLKVRSVRWIFELQVEPCGGFFGLLRVLLCYPPLSCFCTSRRSKTSCVPQWTKKENRNFVHWGLLFCLEWFAAKLSHASRRRCYPGLAYIFCQCLIFL